MQCFYVCKQDAINRYIFVLAITDISSYYHTLFLKIYDFDVFAYDLSLTSMFLMKVRKRAEWIPWTIFTYCHRLLKMTMESEINPF